ncbi:MAG: hypothetical protein GY772_23380 [bacterium]|nr:hypothetical protein [bacterium]
MAKRRPKKGSPAAVDSVSVCAGRECDASLSPVVATTPYEGFHYTTPTAQPRLERQKKRDAGCVEEERVRFCFPIHRPTNKSGVGNKCYATQAEAKRQHATAGKEARGAVAEKADTRFTGYLEDGSYDTRCKESIGKPCSDRVSCPVQLVWVDGKPNLRFCNEQGEPGNLVGVTDPAQATAYAKDACKDWPNKVKAVNTWPDKFWENKAPQVIKDAKRSWPKGGPGGKGRKGLGDAPPPLLEGSEPPTRSLVESAIPTLVDSALPALALGLGGMEAEIAEPTISDDYSPPGDYEPSIEPPEPFDHDHGGWGSDNIIKGVTVGVVALVAWTKYLKPMLAGAKK